MVQQFPSVPVALAILVGFVVVDVTFDVGARSLKVRSF
jgi:hypothetical protein